MVWGLKECLDDLQIKNLELIKDVGAEMPVPKKGEFMSQPHVEASGKRILTRERRDRDSRSLHPGLGEGSSAGKKKKKKNTAAFRKAVKETIIRCQEVPEREHLNREHISAWRCQLG